MEDIYIIMLATSVATYFLGVLIGRWSMKR